MKIITKKILFLLLALQSGSQIYAYVFTMNNFTSKTLLVQVELKASKNPYFALIQPEQSADFSWPPGNAMAGFCLGKIKYLVVDTMLLRQRNLIDRKKMKVIDNGKLIDWLDKYSTPEAAKRLGVNQQPYIRKEAQLRFLHNEQYNATIDNAKRLSKTDFGAKTIGGIADIITQSECRNRDISIIEENGEIKFYTPTN